MKQYYNTDLSIAKSKMTLKDDGYREKIPTTSNQGMIDWIMGLNRTGEYKVNLLNELGIQKQ